MATFNELLDRLVEVRIKISELQTEETAIRAHMAGKTAGRLKRATVSEAQQIALAEADVIEVVPIKKRKKRKVSPEGLRAISTATKARWRRYNKAKALEAKAEAAAPVVEKRKQAGRAGWTPERRAKMAKLMRNRRRQEAAAVAANG